MSNPRPRDSLALDKDNARWLGVCAGVARWLDMPIAVVRVIFVICVISWPTIILAYIIAYFILDRDISAESMQGYFRGADTAEHFRQLNYHKPLYRYPSRGRIAGVCAGLADYLEIRAVWVRLATIASLVLFGPFTVLAYVVCWVAFDIAPGEPVYSSRSARKQVKLERRRARRQYKMERRAAKWQAKAERWGDRYAEKYANYCKEADRWASRERSQPQPEQARRADDRDIYDESQCTEVFRSLELRLREIEAYMTSKRFRLHCEINRI